MQNHEIDYKLFGEEMQFVQIELDSQETVVAESGSFMMMDADIAMQTIFGDGSAQQSGIFGKLLNAGKRILTGESLFMTAREARGVAGLAGSDPVVVGPRRPFLLALRRRGECTPPVTVSDARRRAKDQAPKMRASS